MTETVPREDINLSMKTDSFSSGLGARFTGRRVIYTKESEITRENVVKELKKAMETHIINSFDVDYLYKYEKGVQPILHRVKDVRPTINNRVVENRAHEILQFKNGYQFGSGGFYVRRSNTSEKVENLNREMEYMGKDALDLELGYWLFLSGQAYRMVLPGESKDSPINITILDSRYTAMVRTRGLTKEPLFAFTYTHDNHSYHYYGYTKTHYFEVEDDKVIAWKAHTIGNIPIVEYITNQTRMGAFERVLVLLDALNAVQSDRVNGIEQAVQAYWKFINVDISDEDIEKIPELGAIRGKGSPGLPPVIDYITTELNQDQVQTFKNDLYQAILVICAMPDRQGGNRSTGDTGTAVELRDGWANAETEAKEVDRYFKQSEKKTLELMVRYLNTFETSSKLVAKDIDIKFLRSPRNDRISASQAMMNEAQFGIHPKHIIANSNLYPDAEQVYNDSVEYLKKWDNEMAEEVATPTQEAEVPSPTPVQNQPKQTE